MSLRPKYKLISDCIDPDRDFDIWLRETVLNLFAESIENAPYGILQGFAQEIYFPANLPKKRLVKLLKVYVEDEELNSILDFNYRIDEMVWDLCLPKEKKKGFWSKFLSVFQN